MEQVLQLLLLQVVAEVEHIFGPDGLFSRSKNFEYREQQQRMAMEVARALVDGGNLMVEAGTGVGKSFAYLVPAMDRGLLVTAYAESCLEHHRIARGLLAGEGSMGLVTRFLRSRGYEVLQWGEGRNRGPRPGVQERCKRLLHDTARRHGCAESRNSSRSPTSTTPPVR